MAKTKIQSRPAAWRPKKGQRFEAIVKRLNRPHVWGPFKCDGLSEDGRLIVVTDDDGESFELKFRDFRFAPLDEKPPT